MVVHTLVHQTYILQSFSDIAIVSEHRKRLEEYLYLLYLHALSFLLLFPVTYTDICDSVWQFSRDTLVITATVSSFATSVIVTVDLVIYFLSQHGQFRIVSPKGTALTQ